MPFSINCDFITHLVDCVPRAWNYTAGLQECKTKHGELTVLTGQLNTLKESIISRVDVAELAPDVSVWLEDVESSVEGLDEVLAEGVRLQKRYCICALCPCGCWDSQMFLSQVASKITLVTDLRSRGNSLVVSQNSVLDLVDVLPEEPSVGLQSLFETAWSFIEEDASGIMGVYGMGGVGKTTLLKKMNNKFMKVNPGFDVVIWVVISNEVNLTRIRNKIREKLRLSSLRENEDLSLYPLDIFNRLRSKRFVVLLDDIWKQLDLSSIGIPDPEDPNYEMKSKVVFTTRSEIVCGQMGAHRKIKVGCLNWEKAWQLFQNNVRQNTLLDSDPDIQTLAECVARECEGLPLALVIIGRAMASKHTVGEWNHALTCLKANTAGFADMTEKVFTRLKFSYDNLPNDSVRSCFLFCSLYPEDHVIPIKALIQQWIGEGYMDGFADWQEAIDIGQENIGILKATCLLESAGPDVKMHDIIRDLAHWIACDSGKDEDKIMAKNYNDSTEVLESKKWRKAQTISLWNLRALPNHFPKCPHLSTLSIHAILPHEPKNIFLSTPNLIFLELSDSECGFKIFPASIGKLVKLEYLDISDLRIEGDLPVEMKNLVSLKYLFLRKAQRIPAGVIKNLLNLRAVEINIDGFVGQVRPHEGIQELGQLPRLKYLKVWISNFEDIQAFLGKDSLVSCTWGLVMGSWRIHLELSSLTFSPSLYSSSCLNLGCMKNLRQLEIYYSDQLKELVIDNRKGKEISLFKSLEVLELYGLPNLVLSWDGKNRHGSFFTKLRDIRIGRCNSMVNLKWLCLAPRLEFLEVSGCRGMEVIFLEEDSGACDENTFSSLKKLKLSHLPVLRSICSYALLFRSLQDIKVENCPNLRKLPLGSVSVQNSLRFIEGDFYWWNNLEWENESVKSTFASFFRDDR